MGVMKVHVDWGLRHGIASPTNFAVLLAVLLAFPLLLRWTGALSVAEINPQSAQHTRAFLKFCFVLTALLWVCFAIALVGIRRSGRITWQEIGGDEMESLADDRWRFWHRFRHSDNDRGNRKSVKCNPGIVPAR